MFPKEGEGLYAFACFKTADAAVNAKNSLNNFNFNGKRLYINFYEMKEERKLQQEERKDNVDW